MSDKRKPTPAGWYRDAKMPGTRRYWDGESWTSHVAPEQPKTAGFWTITRAVALGVLAALACLVLFVSCQVEQARDQCELDNIDRALEGLPPADCGR